MKSTRLTLTLITGILLMANPEDLQATKPSSQNWWQQPVRMMRRDYISRFEKLAQSDLNQLARETRELWHCNAEWIMGNLGCSPGMAHITTFDAPGFEKLASLGERDLLREYLPLAHKHGVRLITYLNMHWFSVEFANAHPGWVQILASGASYGQVFPLYGDGTTMCINSPWRDWAFRLITEAAKTGVDGIFLDGPVVFPGCCYCESCQQLFRAQTGADLPREEDWSNPLWKKFIAFREESMANFLRDARAALHTVNPEAVIYLNGGKWRNEVARSPQKLEPYQDITGAEAFFHPGPHAEDLRFTLMAAKFLAAGKNPAMVFTHHALGAWHYIPLPPAEMELALAQTVAGGANPWFAIMNNSLEHSQDEAVTGVAEVQKFLSQNAEIFENEKSCAKIALWASEQTSRYYISERTEFYREGGSGVEKNLIADLKKQPTEIDWKSRKHKSADWIDAEIEGWFRALSRSHLPFDIFWDAHILPEKLRTYDVVILPNVACISAIQKQTLKAFVAAGGTLVADFESGFYDETGEPVADAAWRQFLGIETIEGGFKPSVVEDYLRVKATTPLTKNLRRDQLLARPEFILKVRPVAESSTPMLVLDPIGLSYKDLAGETDYPAAIFRQHRQGQVIYFPALQGEFYNRRKIVQHQILLENAARSGLKTAPLQLEAPATVHLEIRTPDQGQTLHLHLLNNTGDGQRPFNKIIPLFDVRIKIPAPPPTLGARSTWLDEELSYEIGADGFTVILPVLKLYDVVVVDLYE